MYSKEQLKALMAKHPSVRADVQELVARIIDKYYSLIVEQLGNIPPQNSPVNLVMCCVDDSGSMQSRETSGESKMTNGQLVEKGYNTLIEALKGSTAQYRTMVSTRAFNNGLVHSFVRLLDAPRFTHRPTEWATPLYRSALIGMVVLLIKSAILLEDSGIRSSLTLLVMSDGVNYADESFGAGEVATLAASMFKSQHIKFQFIGIGVSHPEAPDYDKLFASMGVPGDSIHTARKDNHAFRRLFGEVTTSIEQHGNGGGGGEMLGGPADTGGRIVEVTEELGELPGYPGARDGNTLDMPRDAQGWPQGNFGGWA